MTEVLDQGPASATIRPGKPSGAKRCVGRMYGAATDKSKAPAERGHLDFIAVRLVGDTHASLPGREKRQGYPAGLPGPTADRMACTSASGSSVPIRNLRPFLYSSSTAWRPETFQIQQRPGYQRIPQPTNQGFLTAVAFAISTRGMSFLMKPGPKRQVSVPPWISTVSDTKEAITSAPSSTITPVRGPPGGGATAVTMNAATVMVTSAAIMGAPTCV